MDKNLHGIGDLFKKALEDNEEIPSQKAWDGIEKKLDNNNLKSIKRKYDSVKKVALLLLFLLAGLSIYVWKTREKIWPKPKKEISDSHREGKKKNALTEEPESKALTKKIDSFAFDENSNLRRPVVNNPKINNESNPESENINSEKSLRLPIAKNISKIPLENKASFKKSQGRLSDELKFGIQKNNKWNKPSNEVVKINTAVQIEQKQREMGIIADKPPGKNGRHENIEYLTTPDLLSKEELNNISLLKINPTVLIGKTHISESLKKSPKQSHLSITAFYSPDLVFYHFEKNALINSNNSNLDKTETESYSSTTGILIDYKISNRWVIESGITLATSNFNLDDETLYAQQDNSGIIQYKLSTPLGNTYLKPSFSNNLNVGDSIFSQSTTQTLQYLEFPIAIKYYLKKGKLTFNALAGISANFLVRGSITTELEYANDNELETTHMIYGLKQFYINGLAGLGADYNFYKNFSVTFSPVFRFALNSINNNLPIQSFPNSFGFALGLKLKM